MSARSMQLTVWSHSTMLLLVSSTYCAGQLVATRDLTQLRPPALSSSQLGHYDEDERIACNGSATADGVNLDRRADDHLDISIIEAKPEMPDDRPSVVITTRLKNLNVYVDAEIPWETSPVIPRQTNQEDPTVSYEAVNIQVWMKAPNLHSGLATLPGGVNLWAQPGNPKNHLILRPGQWVDLKFSVPVTCDPNHEPVCWTYLSGNPVQLVSWWYERDLTHVRKGCVVTDGAYTAREFQSAPFEYVDTPSLKSETPTSSQPTKSKAEYQPNGTP